VENNHPQLKFEIKVYLVVSPDAMWSAIPLQAMAKAGWQRDVKGMAPLFSASALTFIYLFQGMLGQLPSRLLCYIL